MCQQARQQSVTLVRTVHSLFTSDNTRYCVGRWCRLTTLYRHGTTRCGGAARGAARRYIPLIGAQLRDLSCSTFRILRSSRGYKSNTNHL
ncbi:hypothetical protein J6590_023258 [Homalodisca vitripennis]|nr:hypothetical protein J6590_023258 [Homalodisca vitripennis]